MEKEQEAQVLNLTLRMAIAALSASFVPAPVHGSQTDGVAVQATAKSTSLSSSVQLHSFRTHGRLLVHLDEDVQATWKDVPGGFELLLSGIGLADLGAPVGGERAWIESQGFDKDPRIESLKFEEITSGVRIAGRWRFPKGALAPADATMERFDYREKTPSRYVVDFWPRKGPTVAQANNLRLKREREAEVRRQLDVANKREVRKAEISRVRGELEDLAKFCREPLRDSQDIFLTFSPLREKVEFSRWLNTATPDAGFTYSTPQGHTQDAQYARLALELYQQGNFALVVKTLDFLDAEHPRSQFRHEMKFLRANALIKLGLGDKSKNVLADLKASAGSSPAGLQAGMYSAVTALGRDEYLPALEAFLWLVNRFPSHRLAWVFHLGAAEAAFALRQTERAAKEYQWIVENAKDSEQKASAAFRIGDVYLARGQHEQALAAYYQAVSRFKSEARDFGAVHVNRAEALYWLGQMPRAREEFEGFLKSFPSHPAGWRATFRLGEIAGREAGDAAIAASRLRFTETINRFPFSPGAVLARIRLAPCGDHGGFDFASATKFFQNDAESYTGDGQVILDRYKKLRGLSYVRTLMNLGELDAAIDVAIAELQSGARTGNRPILVRTLRALFRKSLIAKLEAGKAFDALRFYQLKADHIPSGESLWDSPETEFEHLLTLSRSASDLGLSSLAQRISADHERAIRGGGSRSPAEAAAFEERIKRGEAKFTAARALFTSGGTYDEAKIRTLLSEVGEESPHSHEREIILGLMAERSAKPASALAHALRAQLLAPQATHPSTRLRAWIAGLQAKAGDPRAAITIYRELRTAKTPVIVGELGESLGLAAAPGATEMILTEGELLARLGQWGDAAQAYASAVEQGLGGNQALYEYSRSLRKSAKPGDEIKADEAMRKLASSEQDDFWRKLARSTGQDNAKNAKEGGK